MRVLVIEDDYRMGDLATAFLRTESADPLAVQVAAQMDAPALRLWPGVLWLLGGEALLLCGLAWLGARNDPPCGGIR